MYCKFFKFQVTFSKDPAIRNLPWDQKLFAGKILREKKYINIIPENNILGPNSNLTEGAFHQTYSWRIDKGAKVGKYNGLTLLLDAETYDYWYQVGVRW